jgi:hypothetical protein
MQTEMEMRSIHASYVATAGEKEPWFGWSFQRFNYSSVLFCLHILYGFQEATAEELYDGINV